MYRKNQKYKARKRARELERKLYVMHCAWESKIPGWSRMIDESDADLRDRILSRFRVRGQ